MVALKDSQLKYLEALLVYKKPMPHAQTTKPLQSLELEMGKVVKVGALQDKQAKQALLQFLRLQMRSFSWSHRDVRGVDTLVMMHILSVDLARKSVRQKRRACVPERSKVIAKEVNNQLEVGFIRKVVYPDWLANIVLDPKSNG